MSFNLKKFARYVRNDNLEKVKKHVKSNSLPIIEIPLDRKKRTAIHLACKHRSGYCLQYFLRFKINLDVADRDGNLPIHLIFNKGRCLKQDYDDVLQPLLLKCSSSILDTPNSKGITPRELLKVNELQKVKEDVHFNKTDDSQEDIETTEDESNFTEDHWQEKLKSYADEDYENDLGKFEKDEFDDYTNNETYDEWANRISEEYSRKYQPKTHSTAIKKRKIDENKSFDTDEWKLKEILTKSTSDSLAKTMKFITKTKSLFSKTETSAICLQDLPWIKYSQNKILDILLCNIDRSDINLTKKTLKGHLIQWHPDKFSQMCSHRLVEKEKSEILAAVNNFTQIINEAIQNIK